MLLPGMRNIPSSRCAMRCVIEAIDDRSYTFFVEQVVNGLRHNFRDLSPLLLHKSL